MYRDPSYLPSRSSKNGVLIGVMIAIALVVIVAFVAFRHSQPRGVWPAANAPLVKVSSQGGYFSCRYPAAWKIEKSAFGSEFKTHDDMPILQSEIPLDQDEIIISNGASSESDHAAKVVFLADNLPAALRKEAGLSTPSLEAISESDRASLRMRAVSYKESQEAPFRCALGSGTYVEFTVTGAAREMQGVFATVLEGDHAHITVMCLCNPDDWAKARPIFYKMINSLAPAS